MRKELELIQKIEQYMHDELTTTERTLFENEIKANPELRQEVELQRALMTGIERAALKQEVARAGKRFNGGRSGLQWGIGGTIVLVLVVTLFLYTKITGSNNTYNKLLLSEYNEAGGRQWVGADSNLPAQVFVLNTAADTVVETKAGIILSIPANGFLDSNNQPVKGNIELAVKEALDPASIMCAGLNTRAGEGWLETAGMFFLDARKDGKPLKINPGDMVYAEIPTDSVKPRMQLFTGQRMNDGTIDWEDPKPLEHSLIPVAIKLLDFYPPHYLDSLAKWGYDSHNKTFTDSLYYSFAQFFAPAAPAMIAENDTTTLQQFSQPVDSVSPPCGINPAAIRTIWNDNFNNTILATREFEQRIQLVHRSGNAAVLDLYLNNLDKNLSTIDSMAALKLPGSFKQQFFSFAARQDGKVKNGNRQFDKLREYYEKKIKAYTAAITKTQNEFWGKQAALDNAANTKRFEHETDSLAAMRKNFDEEFTLNLKEAWRQLGYDTSIKIRPVRTNFYQAQITTTGWCNVDRYVYESVTNRTTLNYTDSQSGKAAVIKYLPVSFQIEKWNEFDRLYVYLVPDKLSSFMQQQGALGIYHLKLNELINYTAICVGYKGAQAFTWQQANVEAKDHSNIAMAAISNEELAVRLNAIKGVNNGLSLEKENEYILFDITDKKRQQGNHATLELRNKILMFVFPCFVNLELQTQLNPAYFLTPGTK